MFKENNTEQKSLSGDEAFNRVSSLKLPNGKNKYFFISREEKEIEDFLTFEGAVKTDSLEESDIIIINEKDLFNGIFHLSNLKSFIDDNKLLIFTAIIASGTNKELVNFSSNKHDEPKKIPTLPLIVQELEGLAYKSFRGVNKSEHEDVKTLVFHARKRRPYVYLLMGPPSTGKSTISKNLFNAQKVEIINGDKAYNDVFREKTKTTIGMLSIIKKEFRGNRIKPMVEKILNEGYGEDIVDLWISLSKDNRDLAIDSYIPEKHQKKIIDAFLERGYFPVSIKSHPSENLTTRSFGKKRYVSYLGSNGIYNKTLHRIKKFISKIT